MANTDKNEAMQDFIKNKTSVSKSNIGRVNAAVHIYGMPRAALKDLVNHVLISGEYGNCVDIDVTDI